MVPVIGWIVGVWVFAFVGSIITEVIDRRVPVRTVLTRDVLWRKARFASLMTCIAVISTIVLRAMGLAPHTSKSN